jgi:hypothetical protein
MISSHRRLRENYHSGLVFVPLSTSNTDKIHYTDPMRTRKKKDISRTALAAIIILRFNP